jgi:glutaminyl-peptide cyclotransferase
MLLSTAPPGLRGTISPMTKAHDHQPWRRRVFVRAALVLCASLSPHAWAAADIPRYTYRIVKTYPHDPQAFTQGLIYKDGFLYEGTGLKGQSSIRKVELTTGKVLMQTQLPADVFGEGITIWGDKVIGLTWTEQVGFVLDLQTLKLWRRFSYPGEGWGLTHNNRELIMSDGTAELRFLDPVSMRELRRMRVTANGQPLERLNELEWVNGQIFANVWQTDRIARIDPKTGHVVGWIDLTGLLPAAEQTAGRVDVLNGIAYDAKGKRLFVTGKLWPKLFEIELVKVKAAER